MKINRPSLRKEKYHNRRKISMYLVEVLTILHINSTRKSDGQEKTKEKSLINKMYRRTRRKFLTTEIVFFCNQIEKRKVLQELDTRKKDKTFLTDIHR